MTTKTADATQPIECTAELTVINDQRLVRLPAQASGALPSRGQVSATGTIDDQPFAAVIEPDGMRGHFLLLDDAMPSIDAQPGDQLSLTICPTDEWPEPDVPDDVRSALDADPVIADLWETFTPMARREWLRSICSTRNAATRAKRIDVAISKMRDGKRRPCCFDRSSCTVTEVMRSGKLSGAQPMSS